MLDRTELTAVQLGITEAELTALRTVRDDLRTGRIGCPENTLDMTNWTACLCAHARRKSLGAFRGADTADINSLPAGIRDLFTTNLTNDGPFQAERIDRLLRFGRPDRSAFGLTE